MYGLLDVLEMIESFPFPNPEAFRDSRRSNDSSLRASAIFFLKVSILYAYYTNDGELHEKKTDPSVLFVCHRH